MAEEKKIILKDEDSEDDGSISNMAEEKKETIEDEDSEADSSSSTSSRTPTELISSLSPPTPPTQSSPEAADDEGEEVVIFDRYQMQSTKKKEPNDLITQILKCATILGTVGVFYIFIFHTIIYACIASLSVLLVFIFYVVESYKEFYTIFA